MRACACTDPSLYGRHFDGTMLLFPTIWGRASSPISDKSSKPNTAPQCSHSYMVWVELPATSPPQNEHMNVNSKRSRRVT